MLPPSVNFLKILLRPLRHGRGQVPAHRVGIYGLGYIRRRRCGLAPAFARVIAPVIAGVIGARLRDDRLWALALTKRPQPRAWPGAAAHHRGIDVEPPTARG